jgi:hypothetical protein
MKIILGVLFLVVMMTCTKVDYDKTTVGFWVKDSTELPVYVYIGNNNLIDTITKPHIIEPDCDECYVTVELISDNDYDVIMYGRKSKYEKEIYVQEDKCRTLMFLE